MNIAYFGDTNPGSTSRHRADALQRLGHAVRLLDTREAARGTFAPRWLHTLHTRTGYRLLQPRMLRWLKSLNLRRENTDIIWVNGGELLGPRCLRSLRELGRPVVLYNNDDPTGTRDGRAFDSLRQAIPHYDLCVVMREVNVPEYRALGAPKVLRVMMSYDEVVHAPVAAAEIPDKYRSEVCFIGACMPERGPLMVRLLELGVPLSIWGDRWQRAPEWKLLEKAWRGPALKAREYALALAGSKVCLGLLSKGNRDLHTRRSVEIPYSGGLFCAERTVEHQQLYREGLEAIFWADADECARQCLARLAEPERREAIRQAGRRRILELKLGNEDVGRRIIAAATGGLPPMAPPGE